VPGNGSSLESSSSGVGRGTLESNSANAVPPPSFAMSRDDSSSSTGDGGSVRWYQGGTAFSLSSSQEVSSSTSSSSVVIASIYRATLGPLFTSLFPSSSSSSSSTAALFTISASHTSTVDGAVGSDDDDDSANQNESENPMMTSPLNSSHIGGSLSYLKRIELMKKEKRIEDDDLEESAVQFHFQQTVAVTQKIFRSSNQAIATNQIKYNSLVNMRDDEEGQEEQEGGGDKEGIDDMLLATSKSNHNQLNKQDELVKFISS
jgi:hypothetical protein